ncbi:glycoside hydrolase family 108 protein [Pseudoalteromonas maricaloris]|uniref:glycoside hydrolase family 108 protein n=1 Tax=Pseudoalteromonas maricaloris TaxID=184924 RepID=UPI00029A03CF|nr:glycosyl hydrolase 108 family protein [Pseudoalteromonas flavipulchra]
MKTQSSADLSPHYSRAFILCMNWIYEAEGGDSDHSADKGGRTRFGISQAAYPNVNIPHLTWPQAMRIYHRDFWRGSRAKDLADAGLFELALLHCDAAINHGVPLANMLLQKVLGVKVDGILGSRTFAAALNHDPVNLIIDYFARRASKYSRIAVNDPSQLAFLFGWHRRLFKLERHLDQLSLNALYTDEVAA